MGRSSGKHQKQSRLRHTEALISTQREDGLWQSIERDEEELASHVPDHAIPPADGKSLVGIEDGIADQDVDHGPPEPHRDTAKPKWAQKKSATPSAQDFMHFKTETPSPTHPCLPPTRAGPLASVLDCPLPCPNLSTAIRPAPDLPEDVPPGPVTPQPGTKRRRGRPRKSRNSPNWNKRRRVRFSDPIPFDPEPHLEHRDTHIFVRLLKIIVTVDSSPPSQRQELVWNNRAKGWRLAGERSERNIGDIAELFDGLSAHGSQLTVLLAPTVGRGAREPIEMSWNAGRCCFQGVNQDLGALSVALGEMKDMVKDPWARQFVGYVLV